MLTAADRNIGDKMDALRQAAQQLCQETITAELLDIVIGAEAVGHDRHNRGRRGARREPGLDQT